MSFLIFSKKERKGKRRQDKRGKRRNRRKKRNKTSELGSIVSIANIIVFAMGGGVTLCLKASLHIQVKFHFQCIQ